MVELRGGGYAIHYIRLLHRFWTWITGVVEARNCRIQEEKLWLGLVRLIANDILKLCEIPAGRGYGGY